MVEGYSHGMKQRLVVCAALIHRPRYSSSTNRWSAWTRAARAHSKICFVRWPRRRDDFSFDPQHRHRRGDLPPNRHHPPRPIDRLRHHGRASASRPTEITAISKALSWNSPASRLAAAPSLCMSSVVLLLSPFWLSWKNSLAHRSTHSWTRRLVARGCSPPASGWAPIWVIRRVLRYFETVYELGPALAYQLLLIILLTFLSMLLFSNLVAALSTFFLARDLELIHANADIARGFFFARLTQTTVNSSWMVLFFSCRSSPPTARFSAAARALCLVS